MRKGRREGCFDWLTAAAFFRSYVRLKQEGKKTSKQVLILRYYYTTTFVYLGWMDGRTDGWPEEIERERSI